MFGSSKSESSSSQATGSSYSGLGQFAPTNRVSFGGKLLNFDYTNPLHVGVAGGLVIAFIWLKKRYL